MPEDYVAYCLGCQGTRMALLSAGYKPTDAVVVQHADYKRFDPATVGAALAEWIQSHIADACATRGFVVEHRPLSGGD